MCVCVCAFAVRQRQTFNEDVQVVLCFLITDTRGFLLMRTGLEAVAFVILLICNLLAWCCRDCMVQNRYQLVFNQLIENASFKGQS
jgi:hypothetical protein